MRYRRPKQLRQLAVRRQGRRQLCLSILDSHAVFDQEILVIGLAPKREILTAGIGIKDIRPIGGKEKFPDFSGCHAGRVQTANQSTQARADDRIEYHVRLREPQTQIVDVTVEVPAVTATTMRFQLPTWRPGKYMIMDPAGTVRYLHAFDGHGDPLPIAKTDKSTWAVQTNGATRVRVQYRLYANSIRDRTRHVDDIVIFDRSRGRRACGGL